MTTNRNPVAIVTGSSGGIGGSICAALSASGYTVAGISRSAPEHSAHVEAFTGDVADAEDVTRAIAVIIDRLGPPGVLVNNAGQGAFGALESVPRQNVDALFAVNVGGFLNVTRAVLPHMRAVGHGRIVTITSLNGLVPVPYLGLYGATKAALHSLSLSLRAEVRPYGIEVTAIAPGRLDTSFADRSLIDASAFDAPYGEPALEWIARWAEIDGRECPLDPAAVATAVMKVVEAENPPAEVIVGEDAMRLLRRREELSPHRFEEYLRLTSNVSQ